MTKMIKNQGAGGGGGGGGGRKYLSHLLLVQPCDRKRERKEESKTSFDYPRNFICWNLSGQELKFIA